MKQIDDQVFDLVIVGGGPIGMACAIEAEKKKLNYIVIEKGALVNSLFNFPTNMTFFSTSKLLEIGGVPFISHSEKPTRREALEYFRRVYDAWNLNMAFYEEVENLKKLDESFIITTSHRKIQAKYVVLATGFYGQEKKMDVPGENLDKVRHYYREAHPYIGQDILVVGAANSACDVALELFHKGSNVTMVIRGDTINKRVKYWIRPNIENRIKEGSIKAFFNSTVESIHPDFVIIKTPNGEEKIPNDYVLAMTGYTPDFTFLDNLGIERNPSDSNLPDVDPDTLETNIENLFLAGVIVAGNYTSKLFIENARSHAKVILSEILEKEKYLESKGLA
ncbi:YpdA family putative bacillithiol disulfide reductase [Membranihabitans maritimus]|uniref:YpdA family putative bacillithiol disulfide reductase n=1 Tax=Membranihabitans maritimus TaxID=2904244 RepID=UPI001F02CF6E|nr:YpdA family putative bacillithiol disulfide reductase [Membranihabitans maritimus]